MSDYPTLRLTKPATHSPAVTRLQELLDLAGFALQCDGWFGRETHKAVVAFQKLTSIEPDGVAGLRTWAALEPPTNAAPRPEDSDPIVSRIGYHPKPRLFQRVREWADICGVTLHQMGILVSDTPQRQDTLGAHISILRSGAIVRVNPMTDMIWHAQKLSHKTVGIEFNGNMEGIEGDRSTLWGDAGPHPVTDAQVDAANDVLFPWLVRCFEANGVHFSNVHAHRQSSGTRRADPGSEIWQRVGIPWIERLKALGMGKRGDGGAGFSVGDGRSIPKEWNPEYPGKY
jgi:N-acetyl-anhydromuramyl-L-alanine amidase AmpD